MSINKSWRERIAGVSVGVLAAVLYLPLVAAQSGGDESKKPETPATSESKPEAATPAAQDAKPETSTPPGSATDAAKPEAAAPAGSASQESKNKQLANPVESETADKQADTSGGQTLPEKQLAKAAEREPVKFITNVRYLSTSRPAWLESLPGQEGDVYKVAVKAGPYRTVRDCQPDLTKEVEETAKDFVNQHLKAKHASQFISYSLDDLRQRKVIREQFSEQLETSLGLMNQVHVQLVFDNSFRDELDMRWSEIKSKSRLAQTGLGAGVIFLLLGTLFSYFRVDTATKGYYTGRLQFVAAGTILALVAASVLLAKWIPWM